MSIFVIGINHKTAPIALREKAYFALEQLPLYLQDLLNTSYASEAVLLSTCNRSELYCNTDNFHAVRTWFCEQTMLTPAELVATTYSYHDVDAIAHIMQVACGLDSMVLGEPEILGQMKQAFSESCAASAVNTLFHRLFQQVFNVAKTIRTTSMIGACPVSVASAAVNFAKQQAGDMRLAKVALIGAGDTAALLLPYLQAQAQALIIVNRHVEKARLLIQAAHTNTTVAGIDQLAAVLERVDLVFSATASTTPIVTKDLLAPIMQRRHQPLLLIDIAVPRDIEASVATLPNVRSYCIDDLMSMIAKNRQGREHAADKAKEMIEQKSREVFSELESMDSVAHAIRAYRGQIEDICRTELVKAKLQLQQGADPAAVLDIFARAMTKKLMHTPSVQLRQAGAEGRFELLAFAKQLFAIPDPDPEMERL
ncbi:MAG TPA: glutamyl-tRNA reductase [Gammaproteobacteria bacterium]|jgi:glutamyl-tRNA reductase|nr:glutamyl-tRNA reductase [Gammaproteobacteria bacterium]